MDPCPVRSALVTLGMVAVALLGGCASAQKQEPKLVFFPAPPEKPRVQFLTWASGADQVEPRQGSFETFILGEQRGAGRHLNKPS